jgi:hypothetical protein
MPTITLLSSALKKALVPSRDRDNITVFGIKLDMCQDTAQNSVASDITCRVDSFKIADCSEYLQEKLILDTFSPIRIF